MCSDAQTVSPRGKPLVVLKRTRVIARTKPKSITLPDSCTAVQIVNLTPNNLFANIDEVVWLAEHPTVILRWCWKTLSLPKGKKRFLSVAFPAAAGTIGVDMFREVSRA